VKISNQSVENSQAILHIEVEPQEMEESLNKAYHRLVKGIDIPGFRKGKAPRHVLERYVGKEEFQKEALEHLIPQLCNQVIEEQKMEVIAQPQIEVLQVDPVIFKSTFPLRPKVELGDYEHIRLAPEPVKVTEEEINSAIERLRQRHAVWSPAEHPVSFEDLVTIDIEEKRGGDLTNSYQGRQFPVIQDSPIPLPGFTEHLVGMEKGEEREFSLSYPDDYKLQELAGKQYSFKVKLIEIKERHLPDLNDEFAKSLGQGLETLDALRDLTATSLKNIAEERAKRDFEQKVIEAVVGLAKVEFPPILVEQELDRLLSERDMLFKRQGGLESYLKSLNKTEEEVREELRPRATERVTQLLVLGKIAEEKKIEVSPTEIEAEIENMIKGDEKNAEELRQILSAQQGRRWVEESLITQKTVQHLVEIVSGDTTEKRDSAELLERSQDGDVT
jgi:trigger factor